MARTHSTVEVPGTVSAPPEIEPAAVEPVPAEPTHPVDIDTTTILQPVLTPEGWLCPT